MNVACICSFSHVNFNYICVAAVRKEISDETDRETGRSKQISSVPIHLSIYSPNGKIDVFGYCSHMDLLILFVHVNLVYYIV